MPLVFGIILFLASGAIGLFLFFKPRQAIEIQKRFYCQINWRLEPIDLIKEIRNTKIMGLFLMLISLIAGLFLFIKKP